MSSTDNSFAGLTRRDGDNALKAAYEGYNEAGMKEARDKVVAVANTILTNPAQALQLRTDLDESAATSRKHQAEQALVTASKAYMAAGMVDACEQVMDVGTKLMGKEAFSVEAHPQEEQ